MGANVRNEGRNGYLNLVNFAHACKMYNDKKDGYRKQNVRQRQKLISIIDYAVCMTFY